MVWRLRIGLAVLGLALLVACGSAHTQSALSGVHFLKATLSRESSAPNNPGGPVVSASGALISGSGAEVVGTIKVYVLDGAPDHASSSVAIIDVHKGTFAKTFQIIGPGGNEIRLDYVEGGKVLASTVVTD